MDETKVIIDSMTQEGQYIYDLIIRYHSYFSKKDRKYRIIVRAIKTSILICSMGSTVVLGLKEIIASQAQITAGLIISSMLSLLTAISAYFNFEEYWMRNITIHIQLNVLRDNYVYDAKAGILTTDKIDNYRKELEKIQTENITYWKKAIKRI